MAEKETQFEKIKKISKNQKHIRNIATSAHIHHGKCISGDSRILLTDGSIKTAKEIFENVTTNGDIYEENEDYTIFSPKDKLEVFSLNKNTGKIEKKSIQYAWRLFGGKTIKIKLRNGFEIETTPEHKYTIFEEGKFMERQAHKLKRGDCVICARNIDFFWDEKKTKKEEYNFINLVTYSNGQKLIQLARNPFGDLSFVEVKEISESYQKIVYDFTIPETHNFIAEGIDIHNTALTDNLLAASGHMAAKSAGNLEAGMATWQHADEQERLMTVDAANVSMVHKFHNEEYLINLIDTPGHIDFSGNVTRAMRAIDGTVVLVCAVEGIMPQTETVIKQALRERVKPVLFINKVDRLIKELKLTPEQMQQRFINIFQEFNELIRRIAEKEYKEKWLVDIKDGSVAFGSARENWALSVPFMQKKGITFKDIFKLYEMPETEKKEWVWKNAPLYEVLLDMVVKHLPNPLEAQKYRIPKIWHGDLEESFGKGLLHCDPKGKIAFVITRIVIDPRSGKEISAGRLFSGTLKTGIDVYLNLAKQKQKIQQLFIYNGIRPEQVDELGAGNVLAIAGVTGEAGETITMEPETPFVELKHIFEPVITKAIEVTKTIDLPKLVEILKKVAKEDPSIKIEINEQTGESLMSGMGELHLEIIENRIKTEKGLDVKTSAPIIVYRESVAKESESFEGRSPNKHNSFYIMVEPLENEVYQAIRNGSLPEGRIKKKNKEIFETLTSLGWDGDTARDVKDIYKGNIFLDKTRGEVHIGEVIEMVLDAFEMVMDQGPLAREPCMKMKVSLTDTRLHEDAIHRGPAQVYPAVREAIKEAMKDASSFIYEPVQIHLIEVPDKFLGAMTKLIGSKRGQMLSVRQEGSEAEIEAKLPVAEMIGWSSDFRSATEGRGVSSLKDQLFERIPTSLQADVIRKIRNRKGLAENQ